MERASGIGRDDGVNVICYVTVFCMDVNGEGLDIKGEKING